MSGDQENAGNWNKLTENLTPVVKKKKKKKKLVSYLVNKKKARKTYVSEGI